MDKKKKFLAQYFADDMPDKSVHVNKYRLFWNKVGLSWRQFVILSYLHETPFMNIRDLAERMEYSKKISASLMDYIEHLSSIGFIKFTGFPEGGVLLMERGKDFINLFVQVEEIFKDAEEKGKQLSKELDKKTTNKIDPILKKMEEMISWRITFTCPFCNQKHEDKEIRVGVRNTFFFTKTDPDPYYCKCGAKFSFNYAPTSKQHAESPLETPELFRDVLSVSIAGIPITGVVGRHLVAKKPH